jgi:CcmD family protein
LRRLDRRVRAVVGFLVVSLTVVVLLTPSLNATDRLGQPPPPQDEFVPIDQLPPEDQLPAAPLLITAYAVIWLLAFWYFWSISRRQSLVQQELDELSRKIGDTGSPDR